MKVLITGFFAVIYMSNANAAEFCATTTADLHQHLSTAENNGEADTIKLRAGNFDGESQHFKFYSLDNENLTIIGGWTEFFGNPCGQRTENHAFGSTLDGNQAGQVMQLFMGDGGADVQVQGIAFINGRDDTGPGTSHGGGLNVAGFSNWTGNVRIEQCAFINNYAERGSAVAVNGGYRARILNSLFFQNVVKTHAAVYMNNYHGEPGAGLYFVNNTVLNNDVVARQGFRMAGVWVHATCDGCGAFVANNLVWGNAEGDITVSADTHAYLYNNNYDELDGAMPANASNNTSIEPVFEPGILNFTPALDSVMVDAGRSEPFIIIFPPPFGSHWDYGELDANGMERVQNRRVDIGAFEAARESSLFVDGFGL